MINRLNHVAIAVDSLEEAAELFSSLLGCEAGRPEEIPDQKVRVAHIPVGDASIELVEPMSADSPVSRFIEKRGQGLHHICLDVEDLDVAVETLEKRGFSLIDSQPREAAAGRRIAFLHPRTTGGVLIELSERL